MSDRFEEGKAVFARMGGALVRAFLVMIVIALPSVLLPGTETDGRQMVALIAFFLGALTFAEYNATYPGLVEFRYAPPFNRIRFLVLFFTVFAITMIVKNDYEPTSMTILMKATGLLIGEAMDFPYSPVRLAAYVLTSDPESALSNTIRSAAGTAYLISLFGLTVFVLMLRLNGWPNRNGAFNVWVNLPTFDPTTGGDVINRLERDARINIALGFLLPFLIPAVVQMGASRLEPTILTSPQTFTWTMTAWAFLPASLFMRGIAMSKIADMIRERRKLGGLTENTGYIAA
ncbi:hypothetical protein E7811_07645 [Aliigemmobacter aestuarii]|uniref:Uncharacterized protein n=1 Tax=Aliigemmobacter aestuarii TaxID=1445661 RepID=A0A4S3MSJ6_9RHOB|nr:hypothetical protein [Gemmobacter aestuarii]THD85556.1 hypothetical protein E7811_07645 [Gemmobacter aestuarii]